eukprot:1150977-Pelagomonas_calceolata.AAC.4
MSTSNSSSWHAPASKLLKFSDQCYLPLVWMRRVNTGSKQHMEVHGKRLQPQPQPQLWTWYQACSKVGGLSLAALVMRGYMSLRARVRLHEAPEFVYSTERASFSHDVGAIGAWHGTWASSNMEARAAQYEVRKMGSMQHEVTLMVHVACVNLHVRHAAPKTPELEAL